MISLQLFSAKIKLTQFGDAQLQIFINETLVSHQNRKQVKQQEFLLNNMFIIIFSKKRNLNCLIKFSLSIKFKSIMGCNNSLQQTATKPFSQEKYSTKFSQYNFQQLLTNLRTKYSQFRKQKTLSSSQTQLKALKQQIRNIFKGIIKEKLSDANLNKISIKQSKVEISQLILQIIIEVIKFVLETNQNQQQGIVFYEEIDGFLKTLTRFLKTKYPRGDNLEAGDLAKKFREFDSTEEYQYDMLVNCGLAFKSSDSFQITKSIKLFFNKIMDQLENQYPKFKALIESIDPSFKIGRKISENTSKYSKLDTGIVEIKSPQVARVLVKWMDDLQEIIQKPQSRFNQTTQFKFSSLQSSSDPKASFKKSQQSQSSSILHQGKLISQILSLKTIKKQQSIIRSKKGFNFALKLIKIFSEVTLNQTQISRQQMEVIKFCYFNNDYISWIVEEKLISNIKNLIKVGQKVNSCIQMPGLDLAKFKINDLMRCQILGDRKKILEIYDKIIDLEQKGMLQIVKIKNRFQTPLSDAMLFLKFPFSFLICQCQLVLSEQNKYQDLKKSKNTETMNHFLYELERSPFGVLGEISVFLKAKSQSVSLYCDKIKLYLENEQKIKYCIRQHSTQIKFEEQQEPFICTYCIKYFPKFSNLMKTHECLKCSTKICNKCSNRKFEITQSVLLKEVKQRFKWLQKDSYVKRDQIQDIGIVIKTIKTITPTPYSTPVSVQDSFAKAFKPYQKLRKMKDLFRQNRIKASSIMQYLESAQKASIKQEWKVYFILVTYKRNRLEFKLYRYDPQDQNIINVYQPLQKYEKYETFQVNDYDVLLQFSANLWKVKVKGELQKIQQYLSKGMYLFEGQLKSQLQNKLKTAKDDLFLFYSKVQENYLIIDIDQSKKGSKQLGWLKVYLQQLPKVNKLRKHINISQSAVQNQQLKCFQILQWTKFIKSLNLSSNYISDISIVLNKCVNLQILNISHNQIQIISFDQELNQLKILNAQKNKVNKITKVNYIKKITELYLANNQLDDEFIKQISAKHLDKESTIGSILSKITSFQFNSQSIRQQKEKNILENKYYYLSELKSLDLSFNKIKNLTFIKALYLKQMKILNNPLEDISEFIKGYDSLILSNLTLNGLPMNKMPKLCRNLTHFSYINGGLKDEDLDAFIKAQKSVELPNLISLSFQANNIHKVPSLTPFINLQQLNLSLNPIDNFKLINQEQESRQIYRSLRTIHMPLKFQNQQKYMQMQKELYKCLPFTKIYEQKYTSQKQIMIKTMEYFLGSGTLDKENSQIDKSLKSSQKPSSNFIVQSSKPMTAFAKTKSSDTWSAKGSLSRKDSYKSQQSQNQRNDQFQYVQQSASLVNLQYIFHVLPEETDLKQRFTKDSITKLQFLSHPQKFNPSLFIQYNWKNLQRLNICGCQLSDQDWKFLVLNADLFPNLRRLELWSNNITSVKREQINRFKSLKQVYFDGLGSNPLSEDSKKQLSSLKLYPAQFQNFYKKQCSLVQKLISVTLQWKYHSIMGLGGNYQEQYVPCIYRIQNDYFLIFIQIRHQIKDRMYLGSQLQYGMNKQKLFFVYHEKEYQKMGIYMQRFYRISTNNKAKNIPKMDRMLIEWKRDIPTDTTWVSGSALRNL